VNASQFVLRAALKEAEMAEADQRDVDLNRKQFAAFLSALNAEPEPNAFLRCRVAAQSPHWA